MNGMRWKKLWLLILLAALLITGGCRVRTTPDLPPGSGRSEYSSEADARQEQQPDGSALTTDTADREPEVSDSGETTRENPEADRREYDETADAEIIPGAAHTVSGEGRGEAASRKADDSDRRESMLGDEVQKSATRVVSAGEADRMGVADDAKPAETAADYYRVLLTDRTGQLMECKRMYVYWESETEWRTVYRTSPEHTMILESGCYDVSGRLTEERLQVDAGWVARKNPDVIVRVVPADVLGSGVRLPDAAEDIRNRMLRRNGWEGIRAVQAGRVVLISSEMLDVPHLKLAAELLIAKTAYPDLMHDVDIADALKALTEETTGTIPEALFFITAGSESDDEDPGD